VVTRGQEFPAIAYVALGANLGDREAAIRRAIGRLDALGKVEAVSPIYETDPVGYLDQPAFLNAVARLRTALSPKDLLTALHRIEAEAGRVRTFQNAPRPLDLDLLLYDDLIHVDPRLTLPHPRLQERAFVLVPLQDLAPDLVVPGSNCSVRALLRELVPTTGVRLYTPRVPSAECRVPSA
jgi:2-amino-4-hydroxy-6-hydroxymethyldihydropteridine diphosphokinase